MYYRIMPTKKAVKPKVKKGIGLFDHIKQVNQVQNPKYFDTLTEEDKKTWSNWMVLRALSYNPNYTDIVNEFQICLSVKPELMYKALIEIFPKDKGFYPFITGKSREKYGDELISMISKHYELSEAQAIDYLNIFYLTDEGKEELKTILSMYGKTEEEIKKILKT